MPASKAPELTPLLREHALQCWLAQEPTSQRKIARAVGCLHVDDAGKESVSTALKNLLKRLRDAGAVLALSDSVAVDAKLGFRIQGFNFAARPVAAQSLCDALGPYLTDPAVKQSHKSLLKEGLRHILPGLTGVQLRGTKTDEMVLVAASRVRSESIGLLLQMVADLEHPKRLEFGRAIRNLLRYAHERDLLAIILPARAEESPFETWLAATLPMATTGKTDPKRDRERRACRRLHEQLIEMLGAGAPATPDEATVEQANAALDRLITINGDWRNHAVYRRELLDLGVRGIGPYRTVAAIGHDLMVKHDGVHLAPWFYLFGTEAAEQRGKGDPWESLLTAVDGRGFPSALHDLITWVRDYSTLSDTQLAKVKNTDGSRRFPSLRPDIREVKRAAAMSRVRAFRAWLGIAVHVLHIAPAECAPERVFGAEFEEVALALREEWEKRAQINQQRVKAGLPALAQAKHAASSGLQQLIAVAGVIALLAFDKSRHERKLAASQRKESRRGRDIGVDMNALRTADGQTESEVRFAHAYEFSRRLSDKVIDKRGGKTATTNKLKSVVFEDVPTIDLIPTAVEDIRRRLDAKRHDPDLPLDAVQAFLAAIVASGAVRIEECAHMRDDIHFDAKLRAASAIYLRAIDRKGEYCDHVVPLAEELTPRWFVDYVMDVARPKLVETWVAEGNAPHHFLVMDRNGRPFGDPGESDDGRVRDEVLVKTRKGKLEAMFLDFRIPALVRAGLPVTLSHGTNTPHGDRGRVLNVCRNTAGIGSARGGQLAGHVGTTTVDRSYAIASAEAHREILREVLQTRSWYAARFGTPGPKTMAPVTRGRSTEEMELYRQLDEGEIGLKAFAEGIKRLFDAEGLGRTAA